MTLRTSEYYAQGIHSFFIGAALGMLAPPQPKPVPEQEPELPAYRDAIENPIHADFAYEAYRLATDLPCGYCDCPGCYDCTPDDSEVCSCPPPGFDDWDVTR